MRTAILLPALALLAACSRAPAPGSGEATAEPAPSAVTAASATPTATATAITAATAAPPTLLPSAAATALEPPTDPLFGTGPKDVPEVVPGVSIGPVKLGMTREDLRKAGLWVRVFNQRERDDNVILAGPYYIVMRDGKVNSIEAPLTQMASGLRIRGQVLHWRTKFKDVAAAFEDCEPMVRGLCGDWFRCENKRLEVKTGCGGVVHVQIYAELDIYPWEKPDPAAPAPTPSAGGSDAPEQAQH